MKNIPRQDKNQEQRNFNMPTPRQKNETMVRNKVVWQKNILPGGHIDWVIIGFDAPTPVEKKIEAKIGIDGDLYYKSPHGNIPTAALPHQLEDAVRNDVHSLMVSEGSRKLVTNAIAKQQAITAEVVTKKVAVFDKKPELRHEGMKIDSEEVNHSEDAREAKVGSVNGAKPMPLKYLRDRSFNDVPLTAVESINPAKGLTQVASTISFTLPLAAEMKSGGQGLKVKSNQGSTTKSPSLTPKRPRSNAQSCSTCPNSPPAKKPHPAEILKSFVSSRPATTNNIRLDTHGSKVLLTTSIAPRINPSSSTRPMASVSVASRMITHALGLRAIPRVREPEVESR